LNKIAMIFSGIVFVLGLITLFLSFLVSYVLPIVLSVYLIGNSISFSHEILHPNMTLLYILSSVKLVLGAFGLSYFGSRIKG